MKFNKYIKLICEQIKHYNIKRNKPLTPDSVIEDIYFDSIYEWEKLLHTDHDVVNSNIVLKIKLFYNKRGIQVDDTFYTTLKRPSKATWKKVILNIVHQLKSKRGMNDSFSRLIYNDLIRNPSPISNIRIVDAQLTTKKLEENDK